MGTEKEKIMKRTKQAVGEHMVSWWTSNLPFDQPLDPGASPTPTGVLPRNRKQQPATLCVGDGAGSHC